MPQAHVTARPTEDKTRQFTSLRGVHETNTQRDLNLIIEPLGNHFRLRIQADNVRLDVRQNWEAEILLDAPSLWGAVQECRQAWHDHAVYLMDNGGCKTLQDLWDLSRRSDLCHTMLSKLALAGSNLFQRIFRPDGPKDDPKYRRLWTIAQSLRDLTLEGARWIRVTSDCFFAPWDLLYSHELHDRMTGEDWVPEGFWGYRHLVEHATTFGSIENELLAEGDLQFAAHLDRDIDAKFGVPCNKTVLDHLDLYQLRLIQRLQSGDLATALAQAPHEALRDHVLYFCCHAEADGDTTGLRFDQSYLALTDRQTRITATLLKQWLGDEKFERCPVVFLNACQSGQMNSLFYQAFCAVFLDRGASAVIGTQVEMPAVFAGQFAKSFFEEFFRGGQDEAGQHRKIGNVLFKLRRKFLDEHMNPLGLLYSLYMGADVFLQHPLPRRVP